MVLLMCAPPGENLKPNVSKADEAGGKPSDETPVAVNVRSSIGVMALFAW